MAITTSKSMEKAPKNDPTTPFQSADQEAFDRAETDAATAERNAAADKSATESAKIKDDTAEVANGTPTEQKKRNAATLAEVRSDDWEEQKRLYEAAGVEFETPDEPGEG